MTSCPQSRSYSIRFKLSKFVGISKSQFEKNIENLSKLLERSNGLTGLYFPRNAANEWPKQAQSLLTKYTRGTFKLVHSNAMKQKELMWRKVVEAHMPRTTYIFHTSIHAHTADECQNLPISCSTSTTSRIHQSHQVHGLESKQNDIRESMFFFDL